MDGTGDICVRIARPGDREELARLRAALWPESSVEEHAKELLWILESKTFGTMPLIELVAEDGGGTLVGFLEVGLRSHADGCDPAHAVGYVEGWYVAELSEAGNRAETAGCGGRLGAKAGMCGDGVGCVGRERRVATGA